MKVTGQTGSGSQMGGVPGQGEGPPFSKGGMREKEASGRYRTVELVVLILIRLCLSAKQQQQKAKM